MKNLENIKFDRVQNIPIHLGEMPIGITEDGLFFVPFEDLCETLHSDSKLMLEKAIGDSLLQRYLKIGSLNLIKEDLVVVIRADMMAFWLTQVRAEDIDEEGREGLEIMHSEAGLILLESLISGRLTSTDPISKYLEDDSLPVKTYKQALELLNAARDAIIQHYEKPEIRFRFQNRKTL